MGEEKRVGAGNRRGKGDKRVGTGNRRGTGEKSGYRLQTWDRRKEWVQVTGVGEEKRVGTGNRRGRGEKSGCR